MTPACEVATKQASGAPLGFFERYLTLWVCLCFVAGTVKGVDGEAIPGARIEVWEADEDGFYDVQYDDGRMAARAHLYADENGEYDFWGLFPTPYPIPYDGPVGQMLAAVGRSPVRASHLHFMVTAPGYRTLVTHIFVEGDEQLVIGDSVSSDIRGANNADIPCCWYDPHGTALPEGLLIDYRITDLRQLYDIV